VTRGTGGAAAALVSVILALVLLAPGLGVAPFDDPGEGQQAEIARQVLVTGDWVTLRLNGVRYFDKPPLLYWIAAGSFALFGLEEWAARLAPLIGAAFAAAGTAVLGARLLGPGWGLASGCALLSSLLFLVFGRYVRPETIFVAAVQWGFTGLLLGLGERANRGRRWGWLLVGCAGLGLASLAKDPLGLIGPLAAVAVAFGLVRRPSTGSGSRLIWVGGGVLLLLGFGWYVLAAILNPGFAWYTVVDNHLLNVLRLRQFPDEDVPLSALEFLTVTVLGAFPWTIAAALEMVALARRRAWQRPEEAGWVALTLWAAGLVGFFVVAPFKLPHYGLPAYPAIALLAVRYWKERAERARALMAVHLACFALLALAGGVAAGSDGQAFIGAVFSVTDVYTRKEVVVGQDSPLPQWSALAPLVTRAALILGVGSLALALVMAKGAGRAGLLVVFATMLALMPMVSAGAARVASERSVAGLAADLKSGLAPRDLLVHEGPIENSGALEFYSGRRPVLLDARRSVLGMGGTFPDGSGVFWDLADLARVWETERRVFLVTTRAPDKSLVARLPPESVHLLAARNGRWLYSNVGRPIRQNAGRRAGCDPFALCATLSQWLFGLSPALRPEWQ